MKIEVIKPHDFGMCDSCKNLKVGHKSGWLLWCNKYKKPVNFQNTCHLYKTKRSLIVK